MTKDVVSLSISVLLLFRHYISHKITFGAPRSGGVLCSACGAFILVGINVFQGGPYKSHSRINRVLLSMRSFAKIKPWHLLM